MSRAAAKHRSLAKPRTIRLKHLANDDNVLPILRPVCRLLASENALEGCCIERSAMQFEA
jgi:hypothetical protein